MKIPCFILLNLTWRIDIWMYGIIIDVPVFIVINLRIFFFLLCFFACLLYCFFVFLLFILFLFSFFFVSFLFVRGLFSVMREHNTRPPTTYQWTLTVAWELTFSTKGTILIFPLWTFHLYVSEFHHMECIYLSWYDL